MPPKGYRFDKRTREWIPPQPTPPPNPDGLDSAALQANVAAQVGEELGPESKPEPPAMAPPPPCGAGFYATPKITVVEDGKVPHFLRITEEKDGATVTTLANKLDVQNGQVVAKPTNRTCSMTVRDSVVLEITYQDKNGDNGNIASPRMLPSEALKWARRFVQTGKRT